jgi:uncharacterized peroxidase-related enzyme
MLQFLRWSVYHSNMQYCATIASTTSNQHVPESSKEQSMSRLPLHTIETAPEASRPYLKTALANNGFLPNLVASLAEAPASLEAYLTLGQINGRCGLTLAEREVVQITAATIHGCAFCVAGHTGVALKKAGLAPDLVTALRGNRPLSDTRLNAVAIFTRSVIAMRGAVDGQSIEEFRNAGLTDANALEIVLGVSLATLCNFANNLAQNELNAELEDYRWTPT